LDNLGITSVSNSSSSVLKMTSEIFKLVRFFEVSVASEADFSRKLEEISYKYFVSHYAETDSIHRWTRYSIMQGFQSKVHPSSFVSPLLRAANRATLHEGRSLYAEVVNAMRQEVKTLGPLAEVELENVVMGI